ncbi:MAG: endonuclease [Clostridia bacterium]|nr:endonuclease [Clostridia bacterium]
MKQKIIRTTAALLLLATLVGILPVFGSQTLVYSTVSNSGQRDVICTTLDGTGAEDYYGSDYSYDVLSELSTDDLYDALEELMTDTHKKLTTYNDCKNYADKTDCENDDGRIVMLYSSYSASIGDYNGGQGWNREHVWPKSLGGFETTDAGADLHHIRPAESLINSTRGNMLYGNADAGKSVLGNLSSSLGGYYSGGYFEPLDNVKGDVARICLYLYVRWADEYPKCANITNVFQSVDVLLDWCEQDPVDTWEMGRNEVVSAIQGNRNVFIDYPEYAWLLFDEEIPADMITPSGEASDGEGASTACAHKNTEIRNATAATCGKAGYSGDTYCKDCGTKIRSGNTVAATGNHSFGEWKTASDGSKSRTCSVCGKVETEGVVVPGATATVSFTDKANRTTYSTSQQIWKQNGITVTNDKGASTSNVGDYCNPGRFYKSSKVTVTATGMTKIVIDCTGLDTKYVTPWSNSFTDSNATASVSGGTVTITFQDPVDSFTWEAMSAQGRAYKFTVYTFAGDEPPEVPDTTPEVTPPDTTPEITPPVTTPDTTPEVTPPVTTPDTTPEITPPETIPEKAPADCTHANVEYRDAVDPTCAEGYSGDVYCADCGKFLEKGIVYPPVEAHRYDDVDGRLVCAVCGHESTSHTDGNDAIAPSDSPAEDDSSDSTVLLIVALSLVGLAAVAVVTVILLKKKNKI